VPVKLTSCVGPALGRFRFSRYSSTDRGCPRIAPVASIKVAHARPSFEPSARHAVYDRLKEAGHCFCWLIVTESAGLVTVATNPDEPQAKVGLVGSVASNRPTQRTPAAIKPATCVPPESPPVPEPPAAVARSSARAHSAAAGPVPGDTARR